MNIGFYISGIGHLGLIIWVLFGGQFKTEPFPFDEIQVTTVSAEDFEAMTAQPTAPDVVTDVDVPVAPEISETPDLVVPEDEPDVSPPQPTPPLEQPTAPEVDVAVATPPEPEVPVEQPEPDEPEGQEQSDIVGPETPDTPDQNAEESDTAQEEITENSEGENVAEPQEATTTPESSPTIVTEAEATPGAPRTSLRPRARPDTLQVAQEDPVPETPEEPVETPEEPVETPDEPAESDPIKDAIDEALGSESGDEPSGPPMTPGEVEGLRLAIEKCWNIGTLGTDSLNVIVVVGFSMDKDAKPVGSSVKMVSFSGGSDAAAKKAYDAARRAILRCGTKGYNLPQEKYDHWKEIEVTFDPTKMGFR